MSCAAKAGNEDIVSYLLACQQTTDDGSVLGTSPEGSGVSEVRKGMDMWVRCSVGGLQVTPVRREGWEFGVHEST